MAKVVEAANGTGTVTLHVTGLLDSTLWTVDIDGGNVAHPNENVEIAFKTGADVTPLTMDTVEVHLTKPEMARFMHAQAHGGAVAVVSDGTREGYAEFSSAEAG
jgi:predicted RNA methylase